MTADDLKAIQDQRVYGEHVRGGETDGIAWEVRTYDATRLRVSVAVPWTPRVAEALCEDAPRWAGVLIDSECHERVVSILGAFVTMSLDEAEVYAKAWASRCAAVHAHGV